MSDTTSFAHMLRHNENLKVFNNTVPVGILVLRVDDGKVIFSNDFFFQTLGGDGDQILGATWDDFFADSDERQKLMMAFAEQGEVRDFSLSLKRMDGETIWGLASMSDLLIDNDDLLLFSFADTTPLKLAEAALKKSNEELTALARQQIRLNEKLKFEANVRKQFFSIIAHDLKGPFTTLLGMTNMMTDMASKLDKDKLVKFAADVNASGQQVYKLLENLLTWSRLQMDGASINPRILELKSLCDEAIQVLHPRTDNKGITLTNAIDDDARAFADCDMIQMVIRNLVTNAIKFTPSGGNIKVSSTVTDGVCEITVTDNGQGMDKNHAEQIFMLDQKTSTVGTDGETGTGLGLPLCKDMLERNNGQIRVESEPGKGSSFIVTLPLKDG